MSPAKRTGDPQQIKLLISNSYYLSGVAVFFSLNMPIIVLKSIFFRSERRRQLYQFYRARAVVSPLIHP